MVVTAVACGDDESVSSSAATTSGGQNGGAAGAVEGGKGGTGGAAGSGGSDCLPAGEGCMNPQHCGEACCGGYMFGSTTSVEFYTCT